MKERIAICPGSFDPITNGHIDIAQRGLGVFDRVINAVGHNPAKNSLFTTEEKLDMIRASLNDERISVDSFDGLLVDYVQQVGACAILRGLRAVADFELELQLALMNRKLCSEIETFFLMTSFKNLFVSSTIVKITATAGGSVEDLVPGPVFEKLLEKYPQMRARLEAKK